MKLSLPSLSLLQRRRRTPWNWQTKPVIGDASESGTLFAGANWNDPSVRYENGGYTMWASADTSFSGSIKIYRLRSTDRIHWSLSPSSPVLQPTAAGKDGASTETPSVVFFGGQYHMYYTGYPAGAAGDTTQWKIFKATSPDGITWTKDNVFQLAPTDPAGAPNLDFNQFMVAEPGAVVVGSTLHVYFTAIGAATEVGTTWQTIGLVTSTDGSTYSAAARVLTPDLGLYPRATYIGLSGPAATVYNGEVVLYCTVYQDTPRVQVQYANVRSASGTSGWTWNTYPTFTRSGWTSNELSGPFPLGIGGELHLWGGGNDGVGLGIGYSQLRPV